MKIDKESLIKHINNLHISKDVSLREIERQSGVHNVSRIVSGEIKNPTAESWQALHEAFPSDIPEPHYIKGDKVYKNVITGSGNVTGSGKIGMIRGEILSAEEQTLINAIREHGEKAPRIIRKIIGIIDEISEKIA